MEDGVTMCMKVESLNKPSNEYSNELNIITKYNQQRKEVELSKNKGEKRIYGKVYQQIKNSKVLTSVNHSSFFPMCRIIFDFLTLTFKLGNILCMFLF